MTRIAEYCFCKACDELLPLSKYSQNDNCLIIDQYRIEKINQIFHSYGITNISIHHQLIEKIKNLSNVFFVNYDLVVNEEFMDFSKIEIIFKKNT